MVEAADRAPEQAGERRQSWLLTPRRGDCPIRTWPYRLPGVGGAAHWLSRLGLRPGQRLAVAGRSTPATLALLQAAPLLGMTVVLINRRLAHREAQRQVDEAAVDALVTDPTHPLGLGLVNPHAAAAAPVSALPAHFPDLDFPWHTACPLGDGDPALVLFTSGTSGTPKAARLTLGALTAAAAGAVERLGLSDADTWLGCLALDHIGGASFAYRAAICGHRLRLMDGFDAAAVTDQLAEASGISLVPTMLDRLITLRDGAAWPPALRVLLIGGGPLPLSLIDRCRALGRAPCQTYGLTECASQVCTLSPAEADHHRGSAGRPLPGMQVRIVADAGASDAADAADAAATPITPEAAPPCAPGVVGRIEVRGLMRFAGYERHGQLIEALPTAAWLATGDLGEVDADGYLQVHCRREDLILSGGENVYPAAVEAVLEAHPAVAEAGVCGVVDAHWGQVVAAVLVLKPDLPAGEALIAELAAWVAERLGRYQQPRRWQVVAMLPRTAGGKLRRSLLAALLGV